MAAVFDEFGAGRNGEAKPLPCRGRNAGSFAGRDQVVCWAVFGQGEGKMAGIAPLSTVLIALAALCLQSGTSQAFKTTFVSTTGNDANNCTIATPCRTIARALLGTDLNGEVRVLDGGDFGTGITIDRAVHIVSQAAGEAAILVLSGTTGVTINAGPADVVSLRGITIKGTGSGSGIAFNTGGMLIVEGCVVRDLSGTGIGFFPNGASTLVVSNTFVSKVGGRGIHVNPTFGATVAVKAVVSRTEVHQTTGIGVFAQGTGSTGTIDMTVSDSVTSANAGDGIRANSLGGAVTNLSVVRSVSVNNAVGISAANPNAHVRVASTMVTGNAQGWLVESSATLQSYGDNYVDGNGGNEGAMPLLSTK
jgi:hypothetical protein